MLAEERRKQTLRLLFSSGLGEGEVFATNFLSAALVACTDLLALLPMLAAARSHAVRAGGSVWQHQLFERLSRRQGR